MTAAKSNGSPSLAERIDVVETAYEFMLAYAAQGRRSEDDTPGSQIREHMTLAVAALEGLTKASAADLADAPAAIKAACTAFLDVVRQDAARTHAAFAVVMAQPGISSQMVDNLNASIHLRALLTDLFLIDESVKKADG